VHYDIPILVLIFKRPDLTQMVFDQIRTIRPKQLFISADGARLHKEGEREAVEATRKIFEAVDWDCEVKTLYRTENLGCRNAVSGGINWFFEQVEYGIILEEDCVPDLSFFPFVKEMLEKYQDNETVMAISGLNLIDHQFQNLDNSYLFTKFVFYWGWATWRRAWQKNDVHMQRFPEFVENNYIQRLMSDKDAQRYLQQKFHETHTKQNDSWAYAWFYSCILNNGCSIVPKYNLIQNLGFGEEATHTNFAEKSFQKTSKSLNFPLKHPQQVEVASYPIANQFFYAGHKSRFLLLVNKVFPKHFVKLVGKLLGRD
jgi:hypothetical protein